MRQRIFCVILGVVITSSVFTGCSKETTKENGNTVKIELTSNDKEGNTSQIDESTTVENKETTAQSTTTAKNEEKTSQEQETTTKKQETTTAKKEETTKKQEVTTKKQEATTTKKQENTTKKQETTTATKQEQTTAKQEETTTKAPEVAKTWFEQKGYTITPRSQATDLGNITDKVHDCGTSIKVEESTGGYIPNGYKYVGIRVEGLCDDCECYFEMFDRYSGVTYSSSREYYGKGVFMHDGQLIQFEFDGGAGGDLMDFGIICPADYDGVVFLVARYKDVIENRELEEGAKLYTIDEVVQFDPEDCYFLSVDDK